MPLPTRPIDVAFPLAVATRNLTLGRRFLGTAFMVSPNRFLTAGHCLDGVELENDEVVAGVFLIDDESKAFAVKDIVLDKRHDVAHGTIVGRNPESEFLRIHDSPVLPYSADVLTIEYSGTEENVDVGRDRGAIQFTPYFRKGNLVAAYSTTFGFRELTNCLDLSFPALKGASGAPVMYLDSGLVVGMIVGNVERHLMPAQIETVVSSSGEVDSETRYFLPVGRAIRSEYLLTHL